ncbi:5'-3' exoribonuclease 1, partial [Haematococcus lacustris]
LSSDELARNELGGILVFTALDDSQEKEFCKTTMAQVRPELRMAGINVLGTASRKESLLLGLRDLRAALGGRTINTGD